MDLARRLGNAVLMAAAATILCYTFIAQAAQAESKPIAVVPAVVVADEETQVTARRAYWLEPVNKNVVTVPGAVLLLTGVGALALTNNRKQLKRHTTR